MGRTFKDKPDRYLKDIDRKSQKPKEKRFISSKGRQKEDIKKNLERYLDTP